MFSHACLFFVSFLCPGLSSATPSVVIFLCLHPASFPLAPLGHSPPSLLVSAASVSCGLTQRPAAGSRGGSGQPCFFSPRSGLIMKQDYCPAQPRLRGLAAWNPLASCELFGSY